MKQFCVLYHNLSVICNSLHLYSFFFFFNDTATTEIYTLSLHDALPISIRSPAAAASKRLRSPFTRSPRMATLLRYASSRDRKSTRLNSSHDQISYAVFCLKKKKNKNQSSSSIPHHTGPPKACAKPQRHD